MTNHQYDGQRTNSKSISLPASWYGETPLNTVKTPSLFHNLMNLATLEL